MTNRTRMQKTYDKGTAWSFSRFLSCEELEKNQFPSEFASCHVMQCRSPINYLSMSLARWGCWHLTQKFVLQARPLSGSPPPTLSRREQIGLRTACCDFSRLWTHFSALEWRIFFLLSQNKWIAVCSRKNTLGRVQGRMLICTLLAKLPICDRLSISPMCE